MASMTGLDAVHVGPDEEGAPSHGRHFLRVAVTSERTLDVKVKLLAELVTGTRTRFLAFADSRKAVELMVELTQRELEEREASKAAQVLPYGAGRAGRSARWGVRRVGQRPGLRARRA